jgi:hypothetical protein
MIKIKLEIKDFSVVSIYKVKLIALVYLACDGDNDYVLPELIVENYEFFREEIKNSWGQKDTDGFRFRCESFTGKDVESVKIRIKSLLAQYVERVEVGQVWVSGQLKEAEGLPYVEEVDL